MRNLVIAFIAVIAAIGTAGGSTGAPSLPTFEAVRNAYQPSEAWLLDRYGEVIQSFRVDAKIRRLEWVALADLSPALQASLIPAEDKRFLEHDGVDWQAFISAAWDNLWRNKRGQRHRGASTLSMQLVAMLDPALQAGSEGRTLGQKWDQVFAAKELEQRWSKEQILEAYFNLARFRGELTGIAAATRGLFNKYPSGVDHREAAILVALLRGPSASPKVVGMRACAVAKAVVPTDDCSEIQMLAQSILGEKYRLDIEVGMDLAPHLRRLVGTAGSRTMTTLDSKWQRLVVEILHQQLVELSDRNVEDGAVVVLDNASGDVIVYVGSSGKLSHARAVDAASAPRQAGSTLKPFLYGLALEERLFTAASILDDSPLALTTEVGLYIPQNYDKNFKGAVTLRTALASSLNVPAVRVLVLSGFEPFRDRLRALGLETINQLGDYYGYSMALGSAEVTLIQLTNAYRAIANQGRWGPVRFRSNDPVSISRQVMDAGAAFIVADILSDRGARASTFGLENPLATRFWTAVKTGTSKDMRDNWCIGFSDRFTVGVWVGNASGEPMHDVSGVTGAAPIWQEIMHALHVAQHGNNPTLPKGVEQAYVEWSIEKSGGKNIENMEAPRQEWFLAGTTDVPYHRIKLQTGNLNPRIAYPGMGTIIAVDPDIPTAYQKVFFRSTFAEIGLTWKLNGELIADGRWTPVPGHFHLELLADGQRRLDHVRFEVRGEKLVDQRLH